MKKCRILGSSTSSKVYLPVLVNLKLFIKLGKKKKNEMLNVFEDPAVVYKLFLNF